MQSRQSIGCLYTHSMDIDGDSDLNLDLFITSNRQFKNGLGSAGTVAQ